MAPIRIILAALTILGGLLSPASLGQESRCLRPRSLADVPDPSRWPLRFDSVTHDCGPVVSGDQASATFTFVNAAAVPVSLRVQGGCGGWTARCDKPRYLPGERGRIEFTCSSSQRLREGRQSRVWPIAIAERPEVKMAVEVTVEWVPAIVRVPPRVTFPLCRQGRSSRHRMIVAGLDTDFEVTGASTDDGVLHARLLGEAAPLEVGGRLYRAYEVEAELPSDAAIGGASDTIYVETNDPRSPRVSISGHGQVVGEVLVDGRWGFSCEVPGDEEAAATLDLQSWSGKPFRVLGIEIEAGPRSSMEDVEIELVAPSPAAEVGGSVTLALRAKLLNPERRWWVGWARVKTDVTGGQPVPVSIYLSRRAPGDPRPL